MAEYLTFDSTFEGHSLAALNLPPWDEEGDVNPNVVATGALGETPYSGTRMLRCGNAGSGSVFGNIITSHLNLAQYYIDYFLLEWRALYASNWGWTWGNGLSGTHSMEFYDSGAGGAEWYLVSSTSGQPLHWDLYHPGSGLDIQTGGVIDIGPGESGAADWHLHRLFYDRVAGRYKIWFDSTVVRNFTHSMGSYKWDNWTPVANFPGNPTFPFYCYIDSLRLWTDKGTNTGTNILNTPVTSGSLINGDPAITVGSPDGGGSGIVIPKFQLANRRRFLNS